MGELGRRDASKSTGGGALGAAGVGGVRPEESIGSEDPVSKEAAVAAAATLETNVSLIYSFEWLKEFTLKEYQARQCYSMR